MQRWPELYRTPRKVASSMRFQPNVRASLPGRHPKSGQGSPVSKCRVHSPRFRPGRDRGAEILGVLPDHLAVEMLEQRLTNIESTKRALEQNERHVAVPRGIDGTERFNASPASKVSYGICSVNAPWPDRPRVARSARGLFSLTRCRLAAARPSRRQGDGASTPRTSTLRYVLVDGWLDGRDILRPNFLECVLNVVQGKTRLER